MIIPRTHNHKTCSSTDRRQASRASTSDYPRRDGDGDEDRPNVDGCMSPCSCIPPDRVLPPITVIIVGSLVWIFHANHLPSSAEHRNCSTSVIATHFPVLFDSGLWRKVIMNLVLFAQGLLRDVWLQGHLWAYDGRFAAMQEVASRSSSEAPVYKHKHIYSSRNMSAMPALGVGENEWAHLRYLITHIFLPPELPQSSDHGISEDEALARTTCRIAREFMEKLPDDIHPRWESMVRMLDNLSRSVKFGVLDANEIRLQISRMSTGDVRVFMIRCQNAAVVVRKSVGEVTFEFFEISPSASQVMKAQRKLLMSYPGPAITVLLSVVQDPSFLETLSDFLSEMDRDTLDFKATTTKAGSKVEETRDTADPRYITDLLTGILRGFGEIAEIPRIQKRVADDVLWNETELPWRRSPLWLVIRVALQTSLQRVSGDHSDYKAFMLFLMTSLLRVSLSQLPDLQSELLFCMRAKVAVRLKKIHATVRDFVFRDVGAVTEEVGSVLQKRWKDIQAEHEQSPPWLPKQLNIPEDTALSLPRSRAYLCQVLETQATPLHSSAFEPEGCQRFKSFAEYIEVHSTAFKRDAVSLADFERAVSESLQAWLDANIVRESACSSVADIMKQYIQVAVPFYSGNPESSSYMLLTFAELWVALDQLAVQYCRLLKSYSPEIPTALFDSLLLRKEEELSRLARVQTYLNERHERRERTYPSMFSGEKVTEDTFSIRYFNASQALQNERRMIEQEARKKKNEKLVELAQKNMQYQNLKKLYEEEGHTCYRDYRYGFFRNGCIKCDTESKMSALSIEVYEWPLPVSDLEAKALIFELYCPLLVRTWRDTTFAFLFDLCKTKQLEAANPPVTLTGYPNLNTSQCPERRVTVASRTKSFTESHYRSLKGRWPVEGNAICVNNGLQSAMYDSVTKSWVHSDISSTFSFTHHCTFQLPKGSYQQLQFSLDSTSFTSNSVIVSQSDCPPELNIHEFLAFGSMRSGPLLQWLNIAREIRARSLNCAREEVYMLFMQSSSQVGPLANSLDREWHTELQDPEFGLVLLGELEDLRISVEASWTSRIAMQLVISLALRFLASATEASRLTGDYYSLLFKARAATRHWVFELRQILQEVTDEKEIRECQRLLVEAAVICKQTYDVSSLHVHHLVNSSKDIADFISCSIIVYDNTSSTSPDPIGLLARDRQLSIRLEPILGDRILQNRKGLDDGIRQIWDGYKPGSKWRQLPSQTNSWFVSATARNGYQLSQSIHYNLLEGRLLIGGKPVGRLPRIITNHQTFKMILGDRILDVIPANMPGMDFCTRTKIFGHQLYFSLRESDSELIVRARAEDLKLELIPPHHLDGDLPDLFINSHLAWMNLEAAEIEFRPLESLWKSSCNNWRLRFVQIGRSTVYQPGSTLVDVHSPTANMISKQLEAIESRRYHVITYSSEGSLLSVVLPRLGLSFFLNDSHHLQSKNFRAMVVDDNQSSGTMFGLRNQLILCPIKSIACYDLPLSRMVVIPHGEVSIQRHRHHVHVSINTSTVSAVKFHQYRIDSDLGRLVGNVSLVNKLYRAYLHALTSHCLPDPLFGHTGTEEAILELKSSGCQSFLSLERVESDILECIASLVPMREFYPQHLKVMQKIHASSIPVLSRHYDLYKTSKSIIDHATRLQYFNHSSSSGCRFSFRFHEDAEIHLLHRVALRNAIYYHPAPQFSATATDVIYQSRDLPGEDEAAVRSFSAMVHSWSNNLNTASDLLSQLTTWGKLSGTERPISLKYSSRWLQTNLPTMWLSWYNICQTTSCDKDRYPLIFALSAMAYGSPDTRNLLPTLLAFATVPQFRNLPPPAYPSYDLSDGFEPTSDFILRIIMSSCRYDGSPESQLTHYPLESQYDLHQRRRREFEQECERLKSFMANELLQQWQQRPCEKPQMLQSWRYVSHFDLDHIMQQVEGHFQSCYRNMMLRDHIAPVQHELNSSRIQVSGDRHHTVKYLIPRASIFAISQDHHITMHDLLRCLTPPSFNSPSPTALRSQRMQNQDGNPSNNLTHLRSLVTEFRDQNDVFSRLYGEELESSQQYLESEIRAPSYLPYTMDDFRLDELIRYRDSWRDYKNSIVDLLKHSLEPSDPADCISERVGMWPRLTLRSILVNLASTSSPQRGLSSSWKKALISASKALLSYQQSQRLLSFFLNGNQDEFIKEIVNMKNLDEANPQVWEWNSDSIGDWLLIQLECNFLVREVQLDVAQNMISPSSGTNTTLQLNMGEGKSSVIVPLLATCLADGQKLVRIVALKSLAKQTFQVLIDRLGGLVNRRIFCMPFSRNVTLGSQEAWAIHAMYEEGLRTRGILVVQPDHMLSYKLMGVDRQLSSLDTKVGEILLESQRWLEHNSRDVIDEADEVLHVRYQLVYSVGTQSALEDSPHRWLLIQEVLQLVKKHSYELRDRFPDGIQLEQLEDAGSNLFPVMRFLHDGATDGILSGIAKDVAHGALQSFNIQFASSTVKESVLEIMTKTLPSKQHIDTVHGYFGDNSPLWHRLLLLRGLLVGGILRYTFKERRWRVDYGLDSHRSMLAVPYRAKDVPASRAEFSHPDVVIVLTCLCYYYGGLSEHQLSICFDLLNKTDNPDQEYETWVRESDSVPPTLKKLSGINRTSPEQRVELLHLFYRNRSVVNFFLTHVVFPREAKQFPEKIATSSWDIAETKHHVTTGFSGTNDGRYLLPISIEQRDPSHQRGTNAKVLSYLLMEENNHYMPAFQDDGERLSAQQFINQLVEQEVRVLLDVGAQMLELRNLELAECWLKQTAAEGVIFFNDDDDLMVVTRDGALEPFVSSPLSQRVDKCLLYLDDAHTRGTDIKLPRGFRAAVTLGPKVTKDRLVQGCMRMRKLGQGHTVMFFAPAEVDRRIRQLAHKQQGEQVKVLDILRWVMQETCSQIKEHAPQWVKQGIDHKRRSDAWGNLISGTTSSESLASSWISQEARSLDELYGPNQSQVRDVNLDLYPELRRKCEQLGVVALSTGLDEEEEREVTHEVERERQVERPPRAKPAEPHVHPDLARFISTGLIPQYSSAFVPAFTLFTSLSQEERNAWTPQILTTKDFSVTIQSDVHDNVEEYLNPVTWIVSSLETSALVIISPYEANQLLLNIRTSKAVNLHVYTPRVLRGMKSCDDLSFYCIPHLPRTWGPPERAVINRMNLLAGQLYFEDYEDYQHTCKFLGLYTKDLDEFGEFEMQGDGFLKPEHRRDMIKSPFQNNQLPFLQRLMVARRKGVEFTRTHVGKILGSKLLGEEDFCY